MSRIGKLPITIPAGVEYALNGNVVSIKGKKGTLTQDIDLSSVTLSLEDNILTITRASEAPDHRSKHGLYRALIQNMIVGVTDGFKKEMEIVGVGYRANANGQLALGSTTYPLGPVTTEALTSNKTLEINLNGSLYKLLMYKP
jgi:large subunit ribosomal protein L6